MKSVCLISPPSPFLIDDKVFPPLGLLYIGRELKDNGYHVEVYDGQTSGIPTGHDLYGVSITTPQFPEAIETLKHIKGFTSSPVIAGGPHASIDYESCRKAGFDGVVLQEGEKSLQLVLEHGCKLIETPIKEFKHPDRTLIDIKSYKYFIDGVPATSVMTTRGCPYRCGFCCKVNKKVKVFPAEFVIEELRELKDVYGYKAFMFFDDIFILNRQRLFTILDAITPWNIIWRGFARADIVVKNGVEVAKRMAASGCREVGMGVESGSDKILKIIDKDEDTEIMKRAIDILHEAGIRVKGFLIVGLPGESLETVEETRRFLRSSGLDDMDFSIYTPYRMSTIYEQKHKLDIEWNDVDLHHSWYKGKSSDYYSNVWTSAMTQEDIVAARNSLEREFKQWGEYAANTGAKCPT
jgi:radical SAM superfamily enzyme YgiQ (UPF0313 family)